jgi:hypothetical protein
MEPINFHPLALKQHQRLIEHNGFGSQELNLESGEISDNLLHHYER